ncbi:PfkB family carbohydrate kinase [Jatrophihabitans sp. YIM 134969]
MHHVEAAPGADEKATSTRQDVAAGGPAAVAALAFAALAGARPGTRTALLTALGGPVGRLIAADLAAGGVSVLDANAGDPEWMPAISSVRVSPEGRSITSPDASDAPVLAPPRFGSDRPDVVLVDGHHPTLALAVTAWAEQVDAPVVVDLGRPKPVFDTVVPRADVVVASAHHVGRLDELLAAGPAAVAVTAGAAAITWGTRDGRRGEVAVEPVEVVDTLGAGDVFHGAVAHRIAERGLPAVVEQFPAVLDWAARVAAVRVTTVGPHAWRSDPRLAELADA